MLYHLCGPPQPLVSGLGMKQDSALQVLSGRTASCPKLIMHAQKRSIGMAAVSPEEQSCALAERAQAWTSATACQKTLQIKRDGRQNGDGRWKAAILCYRKRGFRVQQRLRPTAVSAYAAMAPRSPDANYCSVSNACARRQMRHIPGQELCNATAALLSAIADHCRINCAACSIRAARCTLLHNVPLSILQLFCTSHQANITVSSRHTWLTTDSG